MVNKAPSASGNYRFDILSGTALHSRLRQRQKKLKSSGLIGHWPI